jgi:magnesium chelatase family protein
VRVNAELRGNAIDAAAPLTDPATNVLESALRAGRLSGRGVGRVRAVARTIADLGGAEIVDAEHVALALNLRADLFTHESRVA